MGDDYLTVGQTGGVEWKEHSKATSTKQVLNTYIVTLTYYNPPVQPAIGQLNVNGFQQQQQYQHAVEIITAHSFRADPQGVTFYKDYDAVAFFPTGQYRSIKKNG